MKQKLFWIFHCNGCFVCFSSVPFRHPDSIMKASHSFGNSDYRFAETGLQPPAESSSATSMSSLSTVSYNELPSKSLQVKSKSHFLTSPKPLQFNAAEHTPDDFNPTGMLSFIHQVNENKLVIELWNLALFYFNIPLKTYFWVTED